MSTTLDLVAAFNLTPRYSKTLDLVPNGLGISPTLKPTDLHWLNGIATGQVNRAVLMQIVLGASSNNDHNLSNSSLLDVFGVGVPFVKIKVAFFWPIVGADGITIGGASNPWVGPFGAGTHKISVPLNSYMPFLHPTTGWVVTPSTGDILRVASGASGATYNMLLAGTDA